MSECLGNVSSVKTKRYWSDVQHSKDRKRPNKELSALTEGPW